MANKCYNSGKISGLNFMESYNNFKEADREIAKMGLIPVNPIIRGLKPSRPYLMRMIYDLFLLLQCSHIYMQSNWEQSRGARIEFRFARLLGKQIWFQSNPSNDE